MKQKCLIPTAIKGTFKQNATRPDIYDLQPVYGVQYPFTYFRLTLPHTAFLINNRAVYVAESHRNNSKVLFTGLRLVSNTIYSGDMFNPTTKKKSLLLFKHDLLEQSFEVYLFPNRNPRKLQPIINEILSV